jgi:hypothetical protein
MCRPDGIIADIHFHEARSDALPVTVIGQSLTILN